MAPSIERIEAAGPVQRARRLCFSDDTAPRITSAAAVKEVGLAAGDHISVNELEELLGKTESRLARDRALMLLGYRDRSSHELRRKLSDDGYPSSVTDAVVARLEELDLVNDARFAELWTKSRAAAGVGARKIVVELRQRGVSQDIVHAVQASLDDSSELERAIVSLRGQTAQSPKEREKLLRRLVSRGFTLDVALRAVTRGPEDELAE